jgi:hypothetical protein
MAPTAGGDLNGDHANNDDLGGYGDDAGDDAGEHHSHTHHQSRG